MTTKKQKPKGSGSKPVKKWWSDHMDKARQRCMLLVGFYFGVDEMEEKDNSWYERGELPPVGSVVLYSYKDGYSRSGYTKDWDDGDELEILSHKLVCGNLLCVVFNKQKQNAQRLVSDCMLPVRTEREKFIDAIKRFHNINHVIDADAYFGGLYDAGFRAPESK